MRDEKEINELKPGDVVHYFSENADRWLNFHTLTENDIECIKSGVDQYEIIDRKLLEKV